LAIPAKAALAHSATVRNNGMGDYSIKHAQNLAEESMQEENCNLT
jgi:hypothetical protein